MKICFITALFCSENKITTLNIPNNFPKINCSEIKNFEINYLLFTNLKKNIIYKYLKETPWEIITIDLDLGNVVLGVDYVRLSRYPKFMGWKLLNDMKIGNEFDIIFFCDTHYSPVNNPKLWYNLGNKILNSKFGLLHSLHNKACKGGNIIIDKFIGNFKGILWESYYAVKCNKEEFTNIQNTIELFRYLLENKKKNKNGNKNIKKLEDNNIFFYNGFFGYNPKCKLVTDLMEEFWYIYTDNNINNTNKKYFTYRDQGLWNFILFRHNLQPLFFNKEKLNLFKKTGKEIIRYKEDYLI
jgi:hypothetical protein